MRVTPNAGALVAGALVLVLVLACGTSARADAPIRLTCDGTARGVSESTSYRQLAKGGSSTSTSYSATRYKERVLFELVDGVARIHLPRSLVTLVNSGSDDGWWPVADLKVGDDAISGHIRINFVNKPSFRIDRLNGDIDLAGLQPFRGQCENHAGEERKF